MEISGRVHKGVVILDEGVNLPEGMLVTVLPFGLGKPRIECVPGELPIVLGGLASSVPLTNRRIYEILDEEDVEAIKIQWNVSS